jgi:tRNA (adenine-N(1)-)-methyltransferase non-catalytic subunit
LHALRSAGAAVNLSMHEPWLRKHQVLPGRTHPTMTTDAGAGGFVLSGNRVLTKEEEERAERAAVQAKARREKEDVHRTRLESAEGGAEEAEEEDARGPESAEEEDARGPESAEEEDARGPESAEAAAKRADTRKRARDEDRGAGEAPAGEEQKADRPEGPARRASTRSKTR